MIFLVWQTYASGQIDLAVNGSSPQGYKYLCVLSVVEDSVACMDKSLIWF
jgi:hypothetical protein